MAEVEIQTQDGVSLKTEGLDPVAGGLILEMGSEVEVVATSKRGRGRPRINKNLSASNKSSDDESPATRKPYRKRPTKSIDDITKAKRKYMRRSQSPGDGAFDKGKIDRQKKGHKGHRKKDSNDKKMHTSKDKNQHRKPIPRSQSPDIESADEVERIISSDEGSVVIMEHIIPPPVTIPSTPPDNSPLSSDYEPDRPRRLEDSSSDGNSSSSSSSDSDSDSDTSIGSRLTDKSDRSNVRTPPLPNNGYDHRSPSPLGWSHCTSSGTEDEDGVARIKNGSGNTTGTPPRSPSSASSESPDKSFQCHTCRKWFSSTVTLRIHKRTHLQRPGGGGGGTSSSSRSSRRYECDCCDATFTRRERLEQHRSEVHRATLTVRCDVCGRGFEDKEQQKRHTALHTADEKAGKCTECGKLTGSWEQLRRHRASHVSPAPHACPLCRKAFTYVHSLSRHMLNHSKAVLKCVVCKTSFDDADSLASHLNSHLDRYKQLKT